jgi:hypothetical protein
MGSVAAAQKATGLGRSRQIHGCPRRQGVVLLGGLVGDGERVMLVAEGSRTGEIEARFSPDPWLRSRILRLDTIERWTILLDGRQRTGSARTGP